MKTRILTLVAVLAVACSDEHPSGDPAPHVTPQPGAELCDEACEAMRRMPLSPDAGPDAVGCEEAQDFPDGDGGVITCEQDCVYQHENGIFWNTECIANAITYCSEIEPVCNPTY